MDELFDPGGRYRVVEHVVRPGWDGPGLIRSMWVGLTRELAVERAAALEPTDRNAVAVRAYDRETGLWLDDGTPAWNPSR